MDILKFYTKLAVIKARAVILRLVPVRPNTDDWDERFLIINLDLIGDLVMLTAVLKHYRAAMPGKKIFLLLSNSSGMSPMLVREYVDEVLTIDAATFKTNPFYGYSFVKKMRRIGFAMVVEQNPAMEFIGKIVAGELGAKEVIGYQGFAIDDLNPPNANFALGLHYLRSMFPKKFTKIVSTIPESDPRPRRFVHMILHYAAIFEGVTGQKITDFVPSLPEHLSSDDAVKKILADHGLAPLSYALFALGTSTPHKEWPVARFAELGKIIAAKGIPIVVIGGAKDVPKSLEFASALGSKCLDLTGKTSISEATSMVRYSLLAISNDTSIVHLAVALKRPSLTILFLAQPGRTALYGYKDINRWVLREDAPCFGDNGRCGNTVGPHDPSPCVAAVTVDDAKRELLPLLDHITSGAPYPENDFSLAT